jgi:hypothetical protein
VAYDSIERVHAGDRLESAWGPSDSNSWK